jgi:hypothetical protein
LDVLNPLVKFSKAFGDFYCMFFYREVSESSREPKATIERGHAQMSPSPFSVTE